MAKEINMSTKGTKRELTIHEKRFNLDVALYLKKVINGEAEDDIWAVLLNLNTICAKSFGIFPETDMDMFKQLCIENLKALEEMAMLQMDMDVEGEREILYQMCVCELTAKKAVN